MSSSSSIDTSQQGSGAVSKVMATASAPRSSSSTNKSKEELRKRKTASYTGIRAMSASGDLGSPPKKRQHTHSSNLFSPIPKGRVEELISGSKVDLSSSKCCDFI